MCLLAGNGLVNEVEFLGLIPITQKDVRTNEIARSVIKHFASFLGHAQLSVAGSIKAVRSRAGIAWERTRLPEGWGLG